MSLRDMKPPKWLQNKDSDQEVTVVPVGSYDIKTINTKIAQRAKDVKRIVQSLKLSRVNFLRIASIVQKMMGTTTSGPYIPPVFQTNKERSQQNEPPTQQQADLGTSILVLAPVAIAVGVGIELAQPSSEQTETFQDSLSEEEFRAEISSDVEGTEPVPDILPSARTLPTTPNNQQASEQAVAAPQQRQSPAYEGPTTAPKYKSSPVTDSSEKSKPSQPKGSLPPIEGTSQQVHVDIEGAPLDNIKNTSFIDGLRLTFDQIVSSLSALVGINLSEQPSDPAEGGSSDAPGRGGRTRWTTDTGFSLGLTEDERRTMSRLFTPAELRELNGVDPRIVRAVIATKIELNARGQDFLVFDGVRTQEEANENARRGTGSRRSRHITGHAVDIYPRIGVGQRVYNIVTEEDQFRREAALQSEVFTRNLRAQGITGDVWLGDNARGGGTVAPGQGWDVPHYQSNVEPAAPNGTKTMETNSNVVINRIEDTNVPINPTQLQSPRRPSARRPTQQTNRTPWR